MRPTFIPLELVAMTNSIFLNQVTEREHERMISELTVRHNEEMSQKKEELRESMEAAHEAELQQAMVETSICGHFQFSTSCYEQL